MSSGDAVSSSGIRGVLYFPSCMENQLFASGVIVSQRCQQDVGRPEGSFLRQEFCSEVRLPHVKTRGKTQSLGYSSNGSYLPVGVWGCTLTTVRGCLKNWVGKAPIWQWPPPSQSQEILTPEVSGHGNEGDADRTRVWGIGGDIPMEECCQYAFSWSSHCLSLRRFIERQTVAGKSSKRFRIAGDGCKVSE